MRTLRLSLVGAAILALFGGMGSAVLAQEDEEPAPPVPVTITFSERTGEDEVCTGDTPTVCTWTSSDQWSATDTRLSGTATTQVIEYFWKAPPGELGGDIFEAYAIEVVNDEGAWVGTGRYVGSDFDLFSGYTLTGEGEYEGLAAFVAWGTGEDADESTLGALIVDGEMPPVPALPAE